MRHACIIVSIITRLPCALVQADMHVSMLTWQARSRHGSIHSSHSYCLWYDYVIDSAEGMVEAVWVCSTVPDKSHHG